MVSGRSRQHKVIIDGKCYAYNRQQAWPFATKSLVMGCDNEGISLHAGLSSNNGSRGTQEPPGLVAKRSAPCILKPAKDDVLNTIDTPGVKLNIGTPTKGIPARTVMAPIRAARRTLLEPGRYIYIYCHIRTKQVIYSLTRVMNKNAALKQLPFLGTRSIPTGLRKDFWRPLATVHFPSGSQGLSAYRQLREFRKRHEHEWDLEGRRYRTNRGIARFIMDQKANTVADLAAVLSIQEPLAKAQEEKFKQDKIQNEETLRSEEARLEELLVKKRELRRSWDEEEARKEFKAVKREKIKMKTVIDKRKKQVAAKAQEEKFEQEKIQNKETMRIEQARLEELRVKQRELRRSLDKEEARKEYEAVKTEKIKLKRVIDKRKKQAAHASDNALRSEGYPAAKQGSKELKQKEVLRFSTKGIKIEWDDVLDAEYAQTWPEEVVHDLMPRKRKQKHFPPSPINPRQLTLSFRPNDDAFTESTQETVTRRPDQQETPKPPLMQRIIDRLRFGRSAST